MTLDNMRIAAASQFQCDLNARPDFRYAVQTSSNLVQWQPQSTVLATNATVGFSDTNLASHARFYRVVTLP